VWELQKKIAPDAPDDAEMEKAVHKTVKKVAEDIDACRLNTAISALMILANKMDEAAAITKRDYLTMITLLSPMAPHLCEEVNRRLGAQKSVFAAGWPKYDPRLVKENKIALIVQVNGRVRDRIETDAGLSEEQALALAKKSEIVQKWILGKEIKRVIFVPDKLVNIVV